MAHYAFLDADTVVTEVITGINETELIEGLLPETWYGNFRGQVCKRTSYNTSGGVNRAGGTALRFNYAGIGYTYNTVRDAFIPPKPYPSWVLNEATCRWEASMPMPSEGMWRWDEATVSWIAAQ